MNELNWAFDPRAMDTRKLIRAVRARPQLWNKQDPLYRKFDVKRKLWKEIFREMGDETTVTELKQRWHNLRDVFRREMRVVNSEFSQKRRWIFYDDMLFLASHIGASRSDAEKPDIGRESECVPVIQGVIRGPLKTEAQEEEGYQLQEEDIDCDSDEDVVQPAVQIHMPDAGTVKTLQSDLDNDDYHFAMSIVPHMQKVPMHRKLRMRIKISEIIAEESNYLDSG